LRWAGSKRKLLPKLSQFFEPKYPVYVEPFAGSAALFFHLQPERAVLGDLNGSLISALSGIRDHPTEIFRRLAKIPRTPEEYYKIRRQFNDERSDPITNAAYFIYLNRNSFNGLWRTDSSGRYNVPYGGEKSGATPTLETLTLCGEALKGADLRHADFRATLKAAIRPDAFVYLDPPYFADQKRVFVEYGEKQFCNDDLLDLLQLLNQIDQAGAAFVFTYRDDRQIRRHCARWRVKRNRVMRNVGGFRGSRRVHSEIIVSNVPGD
jgi:DNA adenine methylase